MSSQSGTNVEYVGSLTVPGKAAVECGVHFQDADTIFLLQIPSLTNPLCLAAQIAGNWRSHRKEFPSRTIAGIIPAAKNQATVAQLVEQSIRNRPVIGSNPICGSQIICGSRHRAAAKSFKRRCPFALTRVLRSHVALLYLIKNMIEQIPTHVEHGAGFGDRLLCHPFGQTVILFRESGAAVELTLHFYRFFSQSL